MDIDDIAPSSSGWKYADKARRHSDNAGLDFGIYRIMNYKRKGMNSLTQSHKGTKIKKEVFVSSRLCVRTD